MDITKNSESVWWVKDLTAEEKDALLVKDRPRDFKSAAVNK